ncbi:GTPase Era, mitochondrial-like [Lethenteron reissneri]|uniref:GTPase Era, mitochondrial-like n=1 Tax=Lethenteron reissneri TaxID=7753 RepID=UPI002AB7B3E7|nr:GTPase Era, mitochondrial-like [Lethenteron reissneri]XP_061433729.1 GTPase Era, mitochondrial-like [Lethenteron reissneri]
MAAPMALVVCARFVSPRLASPRFASPRFVSQLLLAAGRPGATPRCACYAVRAGASRDEEDKVKLSVLGSAFHGPAQGSLPLANSLSVSALPDAHAAQMALTPDQPSCPRLLRVAIIGAPNAGKSTLANQILGRKVFGVSRKVHTTRCTSAGVLTEDDAQIVLLDTPGLTSPSRSKRHGLAPSFTKDPQASLEQADVVLVCVDVSDPWLKTRCQLDAQTLNCLRKNPELPSVLVLNKVDILKGKSDLLEITEALSYDVTAALARDKRVAAEEAGSLQEGAELLQEGAEPLQEGAEPMQQGAEPPKEVTRPRRHGKAPRSFFHDVFMVSALNGDEVETLRGYLLSRARASPWRFHSSVLTDQTPMQLSLDAVRARLLEVLPQEVPYLIKQSVLHWEEGPSGELHIIQQLTVTKNSHMRMLLGRGGACVAAVSRLAQWDLSSLFMCDVRLNLSVKLIS